LFAALVQASRIPSSTVKYLFQEIDIEYEKIRQNVVRIFFPSRNKRLRVIVKSGQNNVALTINASMTKLKQCSTFVKQCFSNAKV
jgi:hypothetical protein